MTNQKIILETLLESPKTTGEIAKALGKTDKNGNGKYNVVADDLKRLKKLSFISSKIEKKTGAHGPPPTVYNIIYDVETIINILNSHNSLLTSLQKNDKIIDLIIEKQKENIIYDSHFDFERLVSLVKDCTHTLNIDDITKSELQKIHEKQKTIDSTLIHDFIKKTKLSPTFFKFFLVNNTSKVNKVLNYSFLIASEELNFYTNILNLSQNDVDCHLDEYNITNPDQPITAALLISMLLFVKVNLINPKQLVSDCFFKACVNTDVIEDVFDQKTLKFICDEIDPFKSDRKELIDACSDELIKIKCEHTV